MGSAGHSMDPQATAGAARVAGRRVGEKELRLTRETDKLKREVHHASHAGATLGILSLT
jgi:hypothetical protein